MRKAAPRFLADETIESSASHSGVVFDPIGRRFGDHALELSPSGSSFALPAPALAAGNGAVLKHASNVPGCAIEIEALMKRAGLPRWPNEQFVDQSRRRSGHHC